MKRKNEFGDVETCVDTKSSRVFSEDKYFQKKTDLKQCIW